MRRLKHHRESLTKILRDDRISGSRRILAWLMGTWLDAETDKEKTILEGVILSTYVNGTKFKWIEDDEEPVKTDAVRVENQTVAHMREIINEMRNGKEGQCNQDKS